jgi:hypothetical protein
VWDVPRVPILKFFLLRDWLRELTIFEILSAPTLQVLRNSRPHGSSRTLFRRLHGLPHFRILAPRLKHFRGYVLHQAGHDEPRVNRPCMDALASVTSFDFRGSVYIGCLALPVSNYRVVFALEAEIGEVNASVAM